MFNFGGEPSYWKPAGSRKCSQCRQEKSKSDFNKEEAKKPASRRICNACGPPLPKDLSSLLVGQLRQELEKRGCSTKGLKGVLVERLQEAMRGGGGGAGAAAAAAAAADGAATAFGLQAQRDKVALVRGLKVAELKAELGALGLPVSGLKSVLCERLLEAKGCGAESDVGKECAEASRKRGLGGGATAGAGAKRAKAALPRVDRLRGLVRAGDLAGARARVASLEGEQLRWELHFAESKHELDYGDWGGKNCKGEYDTYDDNALLLAARGGYWCGGLQQQSEMVRLLLHAGADLRLSSYPSGIDGDCDTALSVARRSGGAGSAAAAPSAAARVELRAHMSEADVVRAVVRERRAQAERQTTLLLLTAAAAYFPAENTARSDGQGRSAYSTEFLRNEGDIEHLRKTRGLPPRRDGVPPTSLSGLRGALDAVLSVPAREAAGEFSGASLSVGEEAEVAQLVHRLEDLKRAEAAEREKRRLQREQREQQKRQQLQQRQQRRQQQQALRQQQQQQRQAAGLPAFGTNSKGCLGQPGCDMAPAGACAFGCCAVCCRAKGGTCARHKRF